MLKVLFTLDYEIHGNGDGCPYALMVEPTDRLLRQLEAFGAKLTIMADVAEILKFKEYAERQGRDDCHYAKIARQLQDAVRRGHDVQLHLHASYFNAQFKNQRWAQDWSEYNFAGLPLARLSEIVRTGKRYLEGLLQPVKANYRCVAFRAANWAVSPSRNVVRALLNNGIQIDTSVFKYGRREGLVQFDYNSAYSSALPWAVDEDDVCARNPRGQLIEFPIYSENRPLWAFVTPQRLYRLWVSRRHKLSNGHVVRPPMVSGVAKSGPNGAARARGFTGRSAWKADFNQCSGRQLVRALKRAEAEHSTAGGEIPFVLIGHSKLFTPFNERSLRPFLCFVANHPERCRFATFGDFDLEKIAGRMRSAAAEPGPKQRPVCALEG